MANLVADPAEVLRVELVRDAVVFLRFANGDKGFVDLRPLMTGPVFDEIFYNGEFDTVQVDADLGTIAWSNGADLDPDVLHSHMTSNDSGAFAVEKTDGPSRSTHGVPLDVMHEFHNVYRRYWPADSRSSQLPISTVDNNFIFDETVDETLDLRFEMHCDIEYSFNRLHDVDLRTSYGFADSPKKLPAK